MTRRPAPIEMRQAYAAEREIPRKYRPAYFKGTGAKSRSAAIRSHCLECMGWSSSAVDSCDLEGCALWPYRAPRAMAPDPDTETTGSEASGVPNVEKTAPCELESSAVTKHRPEIRPRD